MLSSVGSCLLGWQPLPINNGVRVPESTGYGNGKWSPTDEQPTVALTGDRLRADAPRGDSTGSSIGGSDGLH